MADDDFSVKIKPDLKEFEKTLETGIAKALSGLTGDIKKTLGGSEKAAEQVARSIVKAFGSAADGVGDSFKGKHPFRPLGDEADAAARRVRDTFRDAAHDSDRALSKIDGGRFDGITQGIKGMVAAAAGLAIVDAGIDALRESVNLASDLGESTTKVEQVFGDLAPQMIAFAEAAPNALGQTRAEALEAVGTYGNLFRSIGLTEGQAGEFSTTLTALASDLASFNNTSVDEAIEALRGGLIGSTEPLRRYGVNINEVALREEAMRLGLVKGKETMTAAAKAQAAYALIMKQTALAQGDFARTSGGLANQQRILRANVDELKVGFGEGLLPALEGIVPNVVSLTQELVPLASTIGAGVGSAIAGTVSGFQSFIDGVNVLRGVLSGGDIAGGLAESIGSIVGWSSDSGQVDLMATAFEGVGTAIDLVVIAGDGVRAMIVNLDPVVDDLTAGLKDQQDILLPVAAGFATFAGTLIGFSQASSIASSVATGFAALGPMIAKALAPLAAAAASPVGLAIAGVAALAVGAYVAYQKFEPFRNAVDNIARAVRDAAQGAFVWLQDAMETVAPIAADLGARLVDIGGSVADFAGRVVDVAVGLGQWAKDVIAAVQPIVGWMREHLFPVFTAAADFADALGDRIRNVMQIVSAVIGPAARMVSEVFGAAWKVVGPVVMGVLRQWWNAFTTTAKILKEVLGVAFDGLKLVVLTVFNAIKAAVEFALGTIQGLFTFFAGILRGDFGKAWEGLKQIVRAPLDAIIGFVESTFGNVLDFLGTIPGRLLNIGTALFSGFVDAITIGLQTMWDVVSGVFGNLLNLFGGLPGRLLALGGDLFGFIVRQAADLLPKVGEWLSQIPGKVGELAGALLVQGVELGKAVLNGIISGLSGLVDSAGGLIGDLTDAITGIGKGIINALIDGLNNLFPNEIGSISVAGREVFGGIDLPDNPIPKLADGIITDHPMVAMIGEAGREAVLPLDNPVRTAQLARQAGLIDPTGALAAMASAVPRNALHADQLNVTVKTDGSPVRHAIEMLEHVSTAAWLAGADV